MQTSRTVAFIPSGPVRFCTMMRNTTPRGRGSGRGRGTGRGRGRGRFKSSRGRYRGSGRPLTAVMKGYVYYKPSFVENPWVELEAKLAALNVKDNEEIDIDSN